MVNRSLRSALSAIALATLASAQPGPLLFDFEGGFAVSSVQNWGFVPTLETAEGSTRLVLTPTAGAGWKGATLTLPAKDLSGNLGVAMVLRNKTDKGFAVQCQVDDSDHNYPWSQGYVWLDPGATDTLFVHMHRKTAPAYLGTLLPGMLGLPGGYTSHWEAINPSRIDQIKLSMLNPEAGRAFSVDDIRGWGTIAPPAEVELRGSYLPLLDSLGQFRHGNWPGKASSGTDLPAQASAEASDLKDHAGPADWNAYGGWTGGPALTATGRFRAEKVDGLWWLATPDGRLFWSHGINCVNIWETTPTAGRENLFSVIPPSANFKGANAKRKFGADYNAKSNALAHQRLRSWGMNSIGNWSDKAITDLKKTAYTVNFATGVPKTLPSVIDTAALRAETRKQIAALKAQVGSDPWCLGVFSDNELGWPTAAATAASVAEDYFRIVSEEMKAGLPGVLYLGSRIHVATEPIWRAAGKYCDVISWNHYEYLIADMNIPADIDKPIMLTEFHYGALDRGLPHPGLRAVLNQRQRANAYRDMVSSCLLNARLVGAHWFQYGDQVYTGRFDGENYQVGFTDIADRPYPEMVAAARLLGSQLYAARKAGRRPDPSTALRPRERSRRGASGKDLPGPWRGADLLGRFGRILP